MLGVRELDAIRQTPEKIDGLLLRMKALEEDLKELTKITRAIKKSVVRKYGEVKEDAED